MFIKQTIILLNGTYYIAAIYVMLMVVTEYSRVKGKQLQYYY